MRLLPYTRTDGYPDVTYHQLEELEITGVKDLREHANNLILTLEKKLEVLTRCTCTEYDKSIGDDCYGCGNKKKLLEAGNE